MVFWWGGSTKEELGAGARKGLGLVVGGYPSHVSCAVPVTWLLSWLQDKGLEVKTFTRGQFWQLASRAAYVLRERLGLSYGDTHVHFFTGNCVEDLAFRLAAVMVGTVPVTVNWDSDPIDRILYKVKSSKAKVGCS